MKVKSKSGATPAAAALPAETDNMFKTTQMRLAHLQELVKVCAFAINADRTLRDLAHALQQHPGGQHLHRLATGPALDDQIATAVLDRVADEMAALCCDLDEVQ